MTAHLKQHAINATADHAPGTNGTLLGTESSAVVEKAFSTTAVAGNIVQRDGNGDVIVPTIPTTGDAAASKTFVLNTALAGTNWKELLLHGDQLLNGGAGGILQAILAYIAVNLTVGDTFEITDGTTTETFTGVGAAPAAFEFIVGGSASATQSNLVVAINADSTLWSAVESTGLDDYFSGAPATQMVIYRTAPSVAADRVFGTLAGAQSDIQVVEFGTGQQDYQDTGGTQSDLPGADPAAKRFGFGRVFASLSQNESHRIAEDNSAYTWDADDDFWQATDTGSAVTEGDGIDVTAGKVSADVAVATGAQQYGGIVKNRNADGSGVAAADAGRLAVQTDNATLEVNASNQVAIKSGTPLSQLRATAVWESETSPDKQPTLSELNAALGTAVGNIGRFCILAERSTALGQVISAGGAGGVGSTSSFWALKIANAGALADYQLVEMS